ncbi:MAG: cysteine dioxygenase family protein [Terriglobia bacterium]|nr:cysteine dioxygenase family protein [Terriglobia bacterium]
MSETAVSRRVPISELVERLRGLPESAFRDIESVRRLLTENPVDPETLAPYLFWDRQHYTRNLIEKTGAFELMAICWEIGQVSAIHNHRDQNCYMAAPIGRLMVQNYRVISKDLKAHCCEIEPTDLVEINPHVPCAVDPAKPVHAVYNPREFGERAVSLHLYSHPFDSCEVYSLEKKTCGDIPLHYTSVKGVKVER